LHPCNVHLIIVTHDRQIDKSTITSHELSQYLWYANDDVVDLAAFFFAYSFSFEKALMNAGIEMGNILLKGKGTNLITSVRTYTYIYISLND
jgi:uncharacterized protein YcsI (UPF0317 family)